MLLGYLSLVAGAAIFVTGTVGAAHYLWFFSRAAQVSGVVVALREVVDGEGDTVYSAVVRFDAEGQTWEITDKMAHRSAAHWVGQAVIVYYPPGDPSRGRLRAGWVLPLCLTSVVASGVWLVFAALQ